MTEYCITMLSETSFSKHANLTPRLRRSPMIKDSRQHPADIVPLIWCSGQTFAVDVETSFLSNAFLFIPFRRIAPRKQNMWKKMKYANETVRRESGKTFQPVAIKTSSGVLLPYHSSLLPRCAIVSLQTSISRHGTTLSERQCLLHYQIILRTRNR